LRQEDGKITKGQHCFDAVMENNILRVENKWDSCKLRKHVRPSFKKCSQSGHVLSQNPNFSVTWRKERCHLWMVFLATAIDKECDIPNKCYIKNKCLFCLCKCNKNALNNV
jgi:hypothetical protein